MATEIDWPAVLGVRPDATPDESVTRDLDAYFSDRETIDAAMAAEREG